MRRKLVLEIGARPAPSPVWNAQAPAPYNCRIGEEIWERNSAIFAEP